MRAILFPRAATLKGADCQHLSADSDEGQRVTETAGDALRRLRTRAGLSLRALGARVNYSHGYLHQIEHGERTLSVDLARRLDASLRADGELTALAAGDPSPVPVQDPDRVAHALRHPGKLDAPTVDALAGTLAAERRLDDVLGPGALLPSVGAQWEMVSGIAREARGPHADTLYAVAAEWVQFLGWLHAEARNDAEAVRVLGVAADRADDLRDGVLAAQVENFRGYLERQRGNPIGIVRHFVAAYHMPGASALQRVGDAVQAAHGYALLGDRPEAERLLGEASDLTEAASAEDAPSAAYWLSPGFSRMGIGLAYLGLGDRAHAADNLRAGLSSLPPGHADADWAAEYRAALADAES